MSDTTDNGEEQGLSASEAAELRRQLADAKSTAAVHESRFRSADHARRQAEMANMSAQERALVSAQESCDTTLESREGEIQSYEDQIAQLADEPGHGKEIAQLNRKMAEAVTEVSDLKRRKQYLANEREKFKGAQPSDAADDPNDRALPNGQKLSNFGPKTQAWLIAHPKAFEDARYFGRAVAAAVKAVQAEGIPDQSDKYFEFIEKELGDEPAQSRQAAEADQDDDEGDDILPAEPKPDRPQHRAAGPGSIGAAPPTRTTPSGSGNGGRRRQAALTAEQREVADNLYSAMPNAADRYVKYAENLQIMTARNPGHFASH